MASAEHLELSNLIKQVHDNLRKKSKLLGIENAWRSHCSDENTLKTYARSMQELATNYWETNNKVKTKAKSRLEWTFDNCITYFYEDIHIVRLKEEQIAFKLNLTINPTQIMQTPETKLKLLDVGSCYNPFSDFKQFEVYPIDIAPANKDVYKCDFLTVSVGYELNHSSNVITGLPENYFDIIVFSLLLEYFPTPEQRLLCCRKAYNLLKTEGLLIIISPDSSHVGVNAQLMKSWRFILAQMGYSRVKYEKLLHIHCMAFRKCYDKAISKRWADIYAGQQIYKEMYIPQDFNIQVEKSDIYETKVNQNMVAEFFNELPNFIQN